MIEENGITIKEASDAVSAVEGREDQKESYTIKGSK
jgi:hypothetical protein